MTETVIVPSWVVQVGIFNPEITASQVLVQPLASVTVTT